ncbi:MAG: YqjK-like family protein [Candidatus Dasytiphilus stammeri]
MNQQKEELFRTIKQQRIDLVTERDKLIAILATYEQNWRRLITLKNTVIFFYSIIKIISLRHPRFIVRWSKRGIAIWNIWKLMRHSNQK